MLVNIQILRGLAAMWVFLHHSMGQFKAMSLSWAPLEWVASFGYIGVDVFFVISGLVIAKTTESLPHDWQTGKQFLLKRFLRIYLGFWPILLLTVAFVWQFSPATLDNKDITGTVLLTNSNMFEIIIPAAWSLPFELYFYLLIGLTLLLNIKNMYLFFGVLLGAILIKLNLLDFGQSAALDLIFSHMIFEFVLGYMLWIHREFFTRIHSFIWLVIAMGSFYFASYYGLINTVWRPLTFGIFAWAVVVLALKHEGKVHTALIKLFKPIGDASYTLYLFHYLMLFMVFESGFRTYLIEHNQALLGYIFLMIITVLISYILYRLIEKPLYQLLTQKIKIKQEKPAH